MSELLRVVSVVCSMPMLDADEIDVCVVCLLYVVRR